MRISHSVLRTGRYALALAVIVSSVAIVSAVKKPNTASPLDKAAYADPALVAYVQPGLVIKIVSAKVATDGTIAVDYKLTDPNGAPLDQTGIVTPGVISVSFLAAYIPKGQTEFVSYITRTQVAAVGGKSAVQASGESLTTGTLQTVAMGEYIYSFKQKVPTTDDPTTTHRVGVYGSRNLTQWDLGTNYNDVTFDFVPAGGANPAPRDVVRTADCNKCHDSLAAHGGSRKSVEICIMCHTPQTIDPDSGNTVDMKVFIHKIHMGAALPSVQAGKPYQIIGFNNSVADYSSVEYPSNPGDPRNCETCHNPKNGAAQTKAWMTNPSQAACGSCHDNLNFNTGANHANITQADNSRCATCHLPSSGTEFDLSITGGHANPTQSASAPGVNVTIAKVTNGTAGQKPTVTFTIKDNAGVAIPMSAMTGGNNRMGLVMSGPTSDYGNTSFGTDVTTQGYVSENPVPTAVCAPDGTCTYTFTHAVPAGAKGTFAIGIEARRGLTLPNAPAAEQSTEYGADNKVFYFSVDGTPVQPRRTIVSIANCNNCHTKLALHGENRNQIEQCVLCHNSNENDAARRVTALVPADKAAPPQSVNFALMIHKIHTGETMGSAGLTYTIVGFGGTHNEFNEVRYPAMGPTGETADTAKCAMCHVNGSQGVLPVGKNAVKDPQGLLNPAPATTSACTACHFNTNAFAHSIANTDARFGESCDVCHATGAAYDVNKVHAGH